MNGTNNNLTYDILKLIASCKRGMIRNQIKKHFPNSWKIIRKFVYKDWIVRIFDGKHYRYYITEYGISKIRRLKNMVTPINESEWYYYVRKGTNDRWINFSGVVNVCDIEHVDDMLDHLNRYKSIWEALSIADYNEKFGVVSD